jgi:hypothetical protein
MAVMRPAPCSVLLLAAGALGGGCSLWVSTDGLAGGVPPRDAGPDAPSDASADVGLDGSVDTGGADTQPPLDAGAPAVTQTLTSACAHCAAVTVASQGDVKGSSLLVAFVYTCAPGDTGCPTPTISDTLGSAWSAPKIEGTLGVGASYMWFACASPSGPDVVKATNSSASTDYAMTLHVLAVDGIANSACLDTSGAASGSGAMASATTASPLAGAGERVVAFFASNGAPTTYAAGQGFTLNTSTPPSNPAVAMTESALVAAGSAPVTASAPWNQPSETWHGIVAAFKPR